MNAGVLVVERIYAGHIPFLLKSVISYLHEILAQVEVLEYGLTAEPNKIITRQHRSIINQANVYYARSRKERETGFLPIISKWPKPLPYFSDRSKQTKPMIQNHVTAGQTGSLKNTTQINQITRVARRF